MRKVLVLLLLAFILFLLVARIALPGQFASLERIPEPMPDPIFTLPFNEALKKACSEALPLVIYLNTTAREVPGCVITSATSWNVDFNVGVIIGAPTSWERGFKGKVEQRVVAECYGPRGPGHIKAIIDDYKKNLDLKLDAVVDTNKPQASCEASSSGR